MPKSNSKSYATLSAAIFVTLISISACSSDRKIDYELTGTVFDATTQKPLEGVYVVVPYMGGGGVAGGHNSIWCQSTLGMYTKADGKFHFPALYQNRHVARAAAIKPDYAYVRTEITNDVNQISQRKLYLTDQNLFLTPQDPAKLQLNFQSREAHCAFANNRRDAAAAAEFLKIEATEREKFGMSADAVNDLRKAKRELEALPESPVAPQSK